MQHLAKRVRICTRALDAQLVQCVLQGFTEDLRLVFTDLEPHGEMRLQRVFPVGRDNLVGK